MLYLYTVMMLAWDLDNDTHSHFRRYLDVFINQRKISGCIRDFVRDARSHAITAHIRPEYGTESIFNVLRINLPNRITRIHYLDEEGWIDHGGPLLIKGALDGKPFQGGRISLADFPYWTPGHPSAVAPKAIEYLHPSK